MRRAFMAMMMLVLAGCQTTRPGPATDLRYRLPRTDVTATLTLELKSCDPISAQATLKLAALAGAAPAVYLITGEDLASSRIKRGLKISIDDRRVITGVNSSVSDRTPQIIGNYLTAAAKLISLVPGIKMAAPARCSPEIISVLKRRGAIEKQLTQLRSDLADSSDTNATPTEEDRQRMQDVESLTKELSGLAPLLVADLTAKVVLEADKLGPDGEGKPKSETLTFADTGPVRPWIARPNDFILNMLFGLSWSAQRSATPSEIPLVPTRARKRMRACGMAMQVPDPQMVAVSVKGIGSIFDADVTGTLEVPAAQLGSSKELCLDAGFGETRAIELAFDPFGQVTSYNWSSESQAEAVSAMVAGNAGNVVSLVDSLEGPTRLDRQKAEIEQLEAAQKLAKLRACKAIMDAGGTC